MRNRNINEEMYWKIQRNLSSEFGKYVLEHPNLDKQIPDGAEIIFQIKDNPDFNQWAKEVAKALHEDKRPLLIVKIERLAPPIPTPSRIINPHLQVVLK